MTATPLPLAVAGSGWGHLVAGTGIEVPVIGARRVPFVNLDNAASTPPFLAALDAVQRAAPVYANVHRGAGYKSRRSTHLFDQARERVARFFSSDPAQSVIFTRNTTAAINLVARKLPVDAGDVVVTTAMEHHSNDLPWRRVADVLHVGLDADGGVNEAELRSVLDRHRGRVAMLAVSGASNVTGRINPVHRWAEWAHEAGAPILVDAAQSAGHRPVDIRPRSDRGHLDFLAMSGHKVYAPFGAGVLVAPREFLELGDPAEVGGGTVEVVTVDRVSWTSPPDREEAGTPCVLGVIALAAALDQIEQLGWEALTGHEEVLTRELVAGLATIDGVKIYGGSGRIGVVSFNVEGIPHSLVAAVLAAEWGIGTRNGCFCAQPYVKHLLGISDGESERIEARILSGDRSAVPGAVRASLGVHNTAADVDRLIEAVGAIARGRFDSRYVLDRVTGEYEHPEWLGVEEIEWP